MISTASGHIRCVRVVLGSQLLAGPDHHKNQPGQKKGCYAQHKKNAPGEARADTCNAGLSGYIGRLLAPLAGKKRRQMTQKHNPGGWNQPIHLVSLLEDSRECKGKESGISNCGFEMSVAGARATRADRMEWSTWRQPFLATNTVAMSSPNPHRP